MERFKQWLEGEEQAEHGPLPPDAQITRSQGDGWKITTPQGYIDYRHSDDTNEIWWVETTGKKGKGHGSRLVDLMQMAHPASSIGWGVTTGDGKGLRDSWHAKNPNVQAYNGAFEGQFDPSGNNYGEDEDDEEFEDDFDDEDDLDDEFEESHLSFASFMEKKTADDIHWPSDCDMKTIERKAMTDLCYVEPGGSHDKIKDRATHGTVTIVPRHRGINPYTCKGIINDIKKRCYRA